MNVEDPTAWAQGANAFKAIFDSLRAAVGLLRDVRASGGDNIAQQRLVDDALDKAERATKVAEAEIAKALGFELCKCQFPPTPMRTVGHIENFHINRSGPIYECPKCGYNTAGPWAYNRIAPPWKAPEAE